MDRRGFIRGAASAAAVGAFGGCAGLRGTSRRRALPKDGVKGFLAHLGQKMWERRAGNTRIGLDLSVWNALTDRMAEKGLNTFVIDIGEGVRYPSHPEIALGDSWEPERMRDEIARLRRMGIMAVPKLNFSASHDQWLGPWRRYLSTPDYYRVCADLVRDVAEIFDESPLFHIGYDEEVYTLQAHGNPHLVRLRRGELWWHDFLLAVAEVEKTGMRPWIWSDACWHHRDEFLARMPKSVMQSNWYYGRNLEAGHLRELDAKLGPTMSEANRVDIVEAYRVLEQGGYDQIPCGSTYRKDGFQTENFPALVRHCRAVVAPERLKGFLMAPWIVAVNEANRRKLLDSVDNAAAALGQG